MFLAPPSRVLLLAVIALLLLAQGAGADDFAAGQGTSLTEPGQPIWASASVGSSLVIPYFELDLSGPSAKTLLYAIHNVFNDTSRVTVSYLDVHGVIVESQTFDLAPWAVKTVNLRDVQSFLPPADPDNVSRGSLSISAVHPLDPAIDRPLAVDYFVVTPGGNFASGGRAAPYHEMVAGPLSPFLCDLWSLRFLNGGVFDGGTQVMLYVSHATPGIMGRVLIDVYDEPGNLVGQAEILTDLVSQQTPIEHILDLAGAAGTEFGVLVITFADGTDGGHVAATYDAMDRFSVRVAGACLE